MTTFKRNRGWVKGPTAVVLCAVCAGGCSSASDTASHRWVERAHQVADNRLSENQTATASATSLRHSPSGTYRAAVPAVLDAGRAPVFQLTANTSTTSPGQAAEPGAPETPASPPETDIGPLPGFGETIARDLKSLPKDLWGDTKAVYGNPWNVVFLLGAGGASAALRPEVDDDIEDHYDKHHSMKEDWRDAFGAAGNPITHFAMVGLWYLVGQQAQDIKTYETSKRMFSALAINGLSVTLLKLAANTESPNGEDFAWPSGHVSSTMALATVLNDTYGPLVGIPMFGLTGMVALERLDSREHQLSDVVFGAALGWVVAEQVMKEHPPEVLGGRIVPYADPVSGNAGVAWVKPLGQ